MRAEFIGSEVVKSEEVRREQNSTVSNSAGEQNKSLSASERLRREFAARSAQSGQRVLAPAQWLRAVMGFEAPFGHDGLPTVWD